MPSSNESFQKDNFMNWHRTSTENVRKIKYKSIQFFRKQPTLRNHQISFKLVRISSYLLRLVTVAIDAPHNTNLQECGIRGLLSV